MIWLFSSIQYIYIYVFSIYILLLFNKRNKNLGINVHEVLTIREEKTANYLLSHLLHILKCTHNCFEFKSLIITFRRLSNTGEKKKLFILFFCYPFGQIAVRYVTFYLHADSHLVFFVKCTSNKMTWLNFFRSIALMCAYFNQQLTVCRRRTRSNFTLAVASFSTRTTLPLATIKTKRPFCGLLCICIYVYTYENKIEDNEKKKVVLPFT
jgi:hypothetical protein